MRKKYIGNLIQNLGTSEEGGGGGDTGVGKPYPGSTGGEYFNYYGDDDNKNTAEGDYSTTIGYNNKNKGKYSFVCGKNNTVNASAIDNESQFVLGKGNTASGGYYGSFIAGNGNNLVRAGAIIAGNSNRTENDYNWAFGNSNNCQNNGYAAGNNLQARGNFCYGQFNTTTWSLNPKPKVVIGCGTNNNSLKNAIEIDSTECKILNNLQLNADTTSVNAITAPQDSSNVTTDDQTLATKSYVDANSGSGGVGEAYPGSTGGEIFNCYEGTDRNEASGAYSTTIGSKNVTSGMNSFTGGKNNTNASENCFVFGQNNNTRRVNVNQYCMVVGYGNNLPNTSAREAFIFGQSNTIEQSRQMKIIGDNNYVPNDKYSYSVLVGNYNQTTPTLSHPIFTVACGTSSLRKNALEIDNTECKILNNLQLATDSTAVNAITPPQDPQNVTADDQTLVTKSYVDNLIASLINNNNSNQ